MTMNGSRFLALALLSGAVIAMAIGCDREESTEQKQETTITPTNATTPAPLTPAPGALTTPTTTTPPGGTATEELTTDTMTTPPGGAVAPGMPGEGTTPGGMDTAPGDVVTTPTTGGATGGAPGGTTGTP